jgi:hypothetical protein
MEFHMPTRPYTLKVDGPLPRCRPTRQRQPGSRYGPLPRCRPGTSPASTAPVGGRGRSRRLLTAALLTPKTAPATSGEVLAHQRRHYRHRPVHPIAAGRPPGRVTSPMTTATGAASPVGCPRVSPVTASDRDGSSPAMPLVGQTGFHGRSRSHFQCDTPGSLNPQAHLWKC